MATWTCVDCCNEFDGPKKPTRCPECDGRLVSSDDYDGPWEVASGTSEGGAGPETSPSYRRAMKDAGRGRLVP